MGSGFSRHVHLKSITLRGFVQFTRHLTNLLTYLASYQVCAQAYTDEVIFVAGCCKNTVISPFVLLDKLKDDQEHLCICNKGDQDFNFDLALLQSR